MFYSPLLPKFKPVWKVRKFKALPIESVVKEGSPVMVWRSNNGLHADGACSHPEEKLLGGVLYCKVCGERLD